MVTTGGRGRICSGFVLDVEFDLFLHLVDGAAAANPLFHLKTEAKPRANLAGNFFLDGLIDAGKNAQLHQLFDNLKRLAFKMFSQIADDDRRFEGDKFTRGGRDNFLRSFGRRRRRRAWLSRRSLRWLRPLAGEAVARPAPGRRARRGDRGVHENRCGRVAACQRRYGRRIVPGRARSRLWAAIE